MSAQPPPSRVAGFHRGALFASVFLVSFVVLGFEISLTRIFSVLLNYHYAFVAVSGAVCGLGLGGFAWHVVRRRGAREAGWAALLFALLIPAGAVLLFGRFALLGAHLWAILVPLLPFCFAGAFLAEVFRAQWSDSGRLYQADLFGAALAAVLVVPLIGLTGALHLTFLWGGLGALGAAGWAIARRDRGLLLSSAATAGLLLICWPVSAREDALRLRPLPTTSAAVSKAMLREADAAGRIQTLLDREWSAYARTDLVRHDFPDSGAYMLQVFTDGENPSQMAPFHGDLRTLRQLRRELPFLAYDLSPHRALLSIGPGAGRDFLWGKLAGFSRLDGVEVNSAMADLLARYRDLTGDVYHLPGVHVTIDDGRSFVRRARERYDLINSTLTQSATAGNTGQALTESYIHTEEAFADYWRHLTPDGRYALVTQHVSLLTRAALTALQVMTQRGMPAQEAWRHLALLALPEGENAETPYRYLLIWKRSPLTPADVARLWQAVRDRVARPLFLPGLGGDAVFTQLASGRITPQQVMAAAARPGGERLDLRPATDDRPFFLDLSFGVPSVLAWFLIGSIGLAALFSLALLARSTRRRAAAGWSTYFSLLGLGFMLIEIPLIQKCILVLGRPTQSLAAILFFLLIGASLGSRLSQRWPAAQLPGRVAAAAALVCLLAASYALALSPVLGALQALPQPGKLALVGLFLFPLGISLGVPFPSGLRVMAGAAAADVPWMWGLNGMLSVVGSTLAAAGAKVIGFNGCLLAAALLYASLLLLTPVLRRAASAASPAPRAETAARSAAP